MGEREPEGYNDGEPSYVAMPMVRARRAGCGTDRHPRDAGAGRGTRRMTETNRDPRGASVAVRTNNENGHRNDDIHPQ